MNSERRKLYSVISTLEMSNLKLAIWNSWFKGECDKQSNEYKFVIQSFYSTLYWWHILYFYIGSRLHFSPIYYSWGFFHRFNCKELSFAKYPTVDNKFFIKTSHSTNRCKKNHSHFCLAHTTLRIIWFVLCVCCFTNRTIPKKWGLWMSMANWRWNYMKIPLYINLFICDYDRFFHHCRSSWKYFKFDDSPLMWILWRKHHWLCGYLWRMWLLFFFHYLRKNQMEGNNVWPKDRIVHMHTPCEIVLQ